MPALPTLQGLAGPCGSDPAEIAEFVAREHAFELVRRFIRSSRVQERTHGITELLEAWLARGSADFSECWHEATSQLSAVLREPDPAAIAHRGVALALHLSSAGVPGAWSGSLPRPTRYRWHRWLLPLADRVAVRSDGAEAIVTLALGEWHAQIAFIRSGPRWSAESGAPLTLLSEVGTCDIPILLLPQAAAGEPLAATVPSLRQTITPDITSAWQDALALLHQYAPAYEAWAQRVVRQIAIVEATPGVVHSGSYKDRHGFIHASAHTSAISMAEMLVHEASHQYFYLLCCIEPVDDGTDTAEYYSPLVQRKRPLDRMLFAFHACANIRRFYRQCAANGLRDLQYCRENEPIVERQLEQLDVPLRDNRALTSVGRTIYNTLQEVVT